MRTSEKSFKLYIIQKVLTRSSIGHGGTSTVLPICGFTPHKKQLLVSLYGSSQTAGESGSTGEVRASAAKL